MYRMILAALTCGLGVLRCHLLCARLACWPYNASDKPQYEMGSDTGN
ncbi:hypothetical protein SAMN05428966_105159 [Massilia sp. PDC64]|nr:hypothetical protein SAMN05428966_105159 [Massilia sp. PDC64]